MGDPVHVGHHRNSLERRMMLDQSTEAQLQVLDQAAGPPDTEGPQTEPHQSAWFPVDRPDRGHRGVAGRRRPARR